MMHELPLIINITLALVVAFIGGMIARKIGLPTIVGYLLAGIAIGPFTPGFVGDVETIQQFAELGVIFLMFGVGLHFSFADLWRVRDIAIPGALIQTAIATLLGFGLSQLWGWTLAAGLVFGLAISVASTVVLLRGLMDHSLLNTPHGQAAVGWLVMEDITFGPDPGADAGACLQRTELFNGNRWSFTLLKRLRSWQLCFLADPGLSPGCSNGLPTPVRANCSSW